MALAVGFVAASAVLLLMLLAVIRQAWRELPAGSLVPVHGGGAGWDKWRPKEKALPVWVILATSVWALNVGIMLYVVTAAPAKARAGLDVATGLLIVPVIILLVSAHFALKAARRRAVTSQALGAFTDGDSRGIR